MSKEKQIEEMTTDIGEKQEVGWVFVDNGEYTTDVFNKELAEYLVVNKGYRKQIENMVEVVRCKDCKHCTLTEDGEYNPEDIVCGYFMTDGMQAYDYCSYGERKE